MSEHLPTATSAENSSQALVDTFVQRLAARETPVALLNDAASVQQRLVAALRPLLPGFLDKRLQRAARICYAFLAQPAWMTRALTATVGGHRASTNRTLTELREAGLVRQPTQGRTARYELTRDGEKLLLGVIGPGSAEA